MELYGKELPLTACNSVKLNGAPATRFEASNASWIRCTVSLMLKVRCGLIVVHIETGESAKQPSMTPHKLTSAPEPKEEDQLEQTEAPSVVYGMRGTWGVGHSVRV